MYILKFSDDNFGLLEDKTNFEDEVVEIDAEVYEQLVLNMGLGKVFKIKNIHGSNFNEIFEEYIPSIIEEENLIKRVELLEEENAALLIDSAVKDRKIVQLETDMADIMKEIVLGGTN